MNPPALLCHASDTLGRHIQHHLLGRNKFTIERPLACVYFVKSVNSELQWVHNSIKRKGRKGHCMIVLFIWSLCAFVVGRKSPLGVEHSLGLLGYQSHQLSLLNSRPQVLQHQQFHILLRLPCCSADVR
jgi:hypothetical protein